MIVFGRRGAPSGVRLGALLTECFAGLKTHSYTRIRVLVMKERNLKAILGVSFMVVALVVWWQVFQFTEASWWGFESEHAKKAPPRAPRIKVLGLESIDLDKAVEGLSQRPSHMGKGGSEEFLQ